ncbi:MAG TPA: FCD domain-containing protein [Bryobacteraceae bacterium]|nr:FCD domain-containing protein [Bryobacteraceae bacterium]
MSFHAVRELFETRLLLEGMIAEVAVQRASDEEIGRLENLAEDPCDAADGGKPGDPIEANLRFHLTLAGMTRNRELTRIPTNIPERTQRLMRIKLQYGGAPQRSFPMLHLPIVRALRERDVSAVREAVTGDIRQAQGATFGETLYGQHAR